VRARAAIAIRALAAIALLLLTPVGADARPARDAAAERPPDVVVFLADDMGFSDLASYGGEIDTPTLDALASDGVRFSQFYVTPRCSPTRAALLTGRAPHAAGVGWLADSPAEAEGYRGAILPGVATLPERLTLAGYRSYAVGKWHLDPALDPAGPDAPLARGFERYFGVLRGADDLWRPDSLARGRERLPPPDPPFYLTRAMTDEAARWVREHHAETPERPLFLFVAFTAPHWPVQAPEADRDAHLYRYEEGWDVVRARRMKRVRDFDVLPGEWQPSRRDPDVPAWADAPHPKWQRARMRAYAGMVRAMDRGIATVLTALEETGRADDTLVLFLSDNGASPETLAPGSAWLRRAAGFWVPEHFGDDPGVEPGGPESFQSYGRAWSNVSNAPFRGHKAGLLEGGIASPLVVRWPAGLRRPPGSWVREPAAVTDLAATVMDLADVPPRPGAAAELDGRSLAPILAGGTRQRDPIFWEHEGWRAVRHGRWKAVAPWRGEWALYDLAADRTELRDVAAAHPEELARLVEAWEAWAERVGVER